MAATQGSYRLERHRSRSWAVFSPEDDLVCITLYRKGAEEVVRRLSSPSAAIVPEGGEASPGEAFPMRDDAEMQDEYERRTN